MLKFINKFWEGQAPSTDPTPIENNEHLKLLKELMFNATRCIHVPKNVHIFRSIQIHVPCVM